MFEERGCEPAFLLPFAKCYATFIPGCSLSMQKGGETLWEKLYGDYFKELTAFGTRMCGCRELAEDLAQETFVKALIHSDTLEDLSPGQRRAWLYSTFKNLFFDWYRRSALENEYVQNSQPQPAESSGMQEVENELFLQAVSPEDRMLFQLRYRDGYTAKEISEMLHLPAGTVRSRLSRCRKRLREEL